MSLGKFSQENIYNLKLKFLFSNAVFITDVISKIPLNKYGKYDLSNQIISCLKKSNKLRIEKPNNKLFLKLYENNGTELIFLRDFIIIFYYANKWIFINLKMKIWKTLMKPFSLFTS